MPLGGRGFRGFPFEEEEGSGAWSNLAARHPDIAARLRQQPAAPNWARKRRPSSQDADEFGDSFSNFDRFPFDDIPPEFREHFPSHFNRRFGQREERTPQNQSPQSPQPQTSQSPPQQQTIATQTEHDPPEPSQPQQTSIPQYGLRNTVDLGQKSAADPSLVDADERNQRSLSAPPESRNHVPKMSAQNHQEPPHAEQTTQQQKVRNIPIFVEGRDQPVINDTLDGATHFGDPKPTYTQHHPQQPPLDNTYFNEDAAPIYNQPSHFSKAFGTPFNKQFRQGGQPMAQQKVYPQAYARGASPARSQSPKQQEDIKIPVHHSAPKPQARPEQPRQQPKPQQQHQPPPQQQQQPPPQQQHQAPPQQQQPPPKQSTPPPTSKPQPPDSITQILAIQTDVLNLMTEVENFTGSKKDKRYIFLDEMLTRNLIKLDNIETEGKENIRNARKEAIRCIQKCIAVLEAKADSSKVNESQQNNQDQGQDVEMKADSQTEEKTQNGEVDMKETSKDDATAEKPAENEQKPEEPAAAAVKDAPQAADTRPAAGETEAKPEDVDNKPKKATKGGKRDKSKDKSAEDKKVEDMQVDQKGENKNEPAQMDVDEGAPSQ